jgi:hypothetical protein
MVKHLLRSSKARPVHPAGERYPDRFTQFFSLFSPFPPVQLPDSGLTADCTDCTDKNQMSASAFIRVTRG